MRMAWPATHWERVIFKAADEAGRRSHQVGKVIPISGEVCLRSRVVEVEEIREPDYTPSSAKFGHRTNHEKSNVLRFSPRLLTHRRPSPGRTIDQVARLKEGIYHI